MFNIFKRVTALEEQQEYSITKQTMDKSMERWKESLDENGLIVFVKSIEHNEYGLLDSDHSRCFFSEHNQAWMEGFIEWLRRWNQQKQKKKSK